MQFLLILNGQVAIIRTQLYKTRKFLGTPKKFVRMIQVHLEQTQCKVSVAGNTSDAFEVKRGLRQGDALSTVLFNLALEKVIRDSGIIARKWIL